MSRLSDLLRAAKQTYRQLRADLEKELEPLQKRLPFRLTRTDAATCAKVSAESDAPFAYDRAAATNWAAVEAR